MSNNAITEFLAYGPERHALETVMRLQAVKRWHMVDYTRTQTLAEHSANVALLAMLIARTAPIEWFDTHTVVAAAALVHDTPEVFTGDIPSHTKRHLPGVRDLEARVSHVNFHVEANVHTRRLIKLCDLADGIRFIRLHGVDITAVHAQEGLEDQLAARFEEVKEIWPDHLVIHVRDHVLFYSYERS